MLVNTEKVVRSNDARGLAAGDETSAQYAAEFGALLTFLLLLANRSRGRIYAVEHNCLGDKRLMEGRVSSQKTLARL